MGTNWRLILAGTALVAAPALGAPAARAGDGAPAGAAKPPAAAPAEPAAPAPQASKDLHAVIEDFIGAPVHGELTTRYRARFTNDDTDQDLYEFADIRIGDEQKDRFSANLFLRSALDLDRAHSDRKGGFTFSSLADTFDSRFTTLLYTAYGTLRPRSGPVETVRVGRQYVYTGETFHFDGASATTKPLLDKLKLQFTAFGGVPVHFYESSSRGDWLAGLRAAAEPWKKGRVALDYTHDQDRTSILGDIRNDLAAASVWQGIGERTSLYGHFTWLDDPRDATVRGTYAIPDADFLVQASYYRLFREKREFATEFDPYYSVIQELRRYHQATLRASKGLGKDVDVEIGGSIRRLLSGEATTPFNRDTRRIYVTPTFSNFPWDAASVSLTGESYTGDGEAVQTWAFDFTQKFSKTTKLSVGSDYSLYAFGPLGADERSHVRTAYARLRTSLSASLSADIQFTWEKDDVETFHVLTLALVLRF